jgi:putative oxidoreductase
LQRLYSTFARGWPGIGLLCLRLAVAIAVFTFDGAEFAPAPSLLRTVIPAVAALLLCAGLWTPIAGVALSIFELWAAFSGKGNFWAEILLAVISAALAMLGPGAWSIDARLFGRKRLIPRR